MIFLHKHSSLTVLLLLLNRMFEHIDTATEEEIFQIIGRYVARDISVAEAAIELSTDPEAVRGLLNDLEVDIQEPSRGEIVKNAAKCLEPQSDGEGYIYTYSDRNQLEKSISAIIEEIGVDPDQFSITEEKLRRQIRDHIWWAKNEDGETDEVFWSEMKGIHQHLGTQKRSRFNIVFPLNIICSDINRPDTYEVLNQTIQALSIDEWEACCGEAIDREQDKADQSDIVGAKNELQNRFENSPNSLDRAGQTYWMFETNAIDSQYAVDKCVNTIEYLLGKINFAISSKQIEGGQMNSSVWNTRWMDLRQPFVYLVFENNQYTYYAYSQDPTPREPIRLSAHKSQRYRDHISDIPQLNSTLNKMQTRFVSGVRSFQDGITNTDREEAFINYWRSIERLSLTSDVDPMSTVVRRAGTVTDTVSVARQSEVQRKRNKLIHEGYGVEITTDDTNDLKVMLEDMLRFYVDKFEDWDHDDFLFYFEHGSKSDAALDHLEKQRQKEIDLINEIR